MRDLYGLIFYLIISLIVIVFVLFFLMKKVDSFLSNKIFPALDNIINVLLSKIINGKSSKATLISKLIDVSFLLLVVYDFFVLYQTFFGEHRMTYFFVAMITLFPLSIIIGTCKSTLTQLNGTANFLIIDKFFELLIIINRINWINYLTSRIQIIFFNVEFMIHLIVFYYILNGYVGFKNLPEGAYFVFFLLLDILLLSFIYVGDLRQENKNIKIQNRQIRRVAVYILLVTLSIVQFYSNFHAAFDNKSTDPVLNLFCYVLLTLFIAIDRLINGILSDIEIFNTHKKS